MPTDASFRFSTYLTFALACVALGYAESKILPEVVAFAALAVLGLGVLYFLERRVALLSIPAANRLGLFIAIGYALWAAVRVARESELKEQLYVGWHVFIVALCGPLVMLLLVAKGARRDKHARDYWTLHGVALAGVALAASFAETPLCFALVAAYLFAAVWGLTLLHLGRARGAIDPDAGTPAARPVAVSADPAGRSHLGPAVLWAAVALAAAVPLYLLTPRSRADKAEFASSLEIGLSTEDTIDLNRVGPLRENSAVAFEVVATNPDGTPKDDLDPNQRWRGRALRLYANGSWKTSEERLPRVTELASTPAVWRPPVLGPGQYTLAFSVPAELRVPIVADPVQWVPAQPPPLVDADDRRGWFPSADGTFLEPTRGREQTGQKYLQVYRTGPDPDIGPPVRFADRSFAQQLAPLLDNPVPRIKDYADALLRDLIRTGELPANCRHPGTLLPLPEYQDKVARRFAQHLATTPTLAYTTEIKRTNREVDPIEDFLYHTKSGHCERFATALALMLRSEGIPTVFVLGFKGCEANGGGRYSVRQEQAHAWVSALVAVPGEPPNPAGAAAPGYQWRSLDPTPGAVQVADADANRAWWAQANKWVGAQFQEYVTGYTPEQRRKSLADFAAHLAHPATPLALGALVAAWFVVRTVRRRVAGRAAANPAGAVPGGWFGELVAVLGTHGIRPAPGDTPHEFAGRAAAALRERGGCAPVAEVPLVWAGAYYRDRYGGVAPSEVRLAELKAALGALRAALRAAPSGIHTPGDRE